MADDRRMTFFGSGGGGGAGAGVGALNRGVGWIMAVSKVLLGENHLFKTYCVGRWHIFQRPLKHGLKPLGTYGDDVVRPVEEVTIVEHELHVSNEFLDGRIPCHTVIRIGFRRI